MAGAHSMVDFVRRAAFGRQPTSEDVPEELARALDASAEDLKHDRIVSLDDMLTEMGAELEAHLAPKRAPSR
jgi:hypothetical protein